MKMHDWNSDKKDVILLIHPMLATGEMMRRLLAVPMGNSFRYLIPDLTGHGDEIEKDYESAVNEAAAIDDYLKEHEIHEIRLAFGASLGAVTLMELLAKTDVKIDRIFFEGASMYEKASFMNKIIRAVMLKKNRKAKAHPEIVAPKMEKLYGPQVKDIMAEQMLGISEPSIINIVRDCGFVRLPDLTEEQQRNCAFAYGEKDWDLKAARKRCPQKYPHAKLKVWPKRAHCGYVVEDPDRYAEMLTRFMNGESI